MPAAPLDALLDLLLPGSCAACDTPGPPACAGCRAALRYLDGPACDGCGAPTPLAVDRCGECAGRLDAPRQALAYEAGPCAALITALKDRGRRDIAPVLARALAHRLPPPAPGAVLVPVPGTPARVRRRGFDHAHLIAIHLGRIWGRPVADHLRRRRDAPGQRGASRTARLEQARGAFTATPGAAPPHAVLVDDVRTTGATLAACAAALRAAGARRVGAACVARAVGGAPGGSGPAAGGDRVAGTGSTPHKERPRCS